MSNPVKPTSRAGLGIVNRHGEFWTPKIFDFADEAEAHFRRYWSGIADAPRWSDYRLVPARVTVEEISE